MNNQLTAEQANSVLDNIPHAFNSTFFWASNTTYKDEVLISMRENKTISMKEAMKVLDMSSYESYSEGHKSLMRGILMGIREYRMGVWVLKKKCKTDIKAGAIDI